MVDEVYYGLVINNNGIRDEDWDHDELTIMDQIWLIVVKFLTTITRVTYGLRIWLCWLLDNNGDELLEKINEVIGNYETMS